jgi:hypothetical protein
MDDIFNFACFGRIAFFCFTVFSLCDGLFFLLSCAFAVLVCSLGVGVRFLPIIPRS